MAHFTPENDLYKKDNEFYIAYGHWDDEEGDRGLGMRWINSTMGFPRSANGSPLWFKIPVWMNVSLLKTLLDFPEVANTDKVLDLLKELLPKHRM